MLKIQTGPNGFIGMVELIVLTHLHLVCSKNNVEESYEYKELLTAKEFL